MENLELVAQGAEGRVYKTEYLGKQAIVKERLKKKYRHPILDEHIVRERMRAEARCLLRSKIAGVRVPTVYFVDMETGMLCTEFIEGVTAKKFIDEELSNKGIENNESLHEVMHLIGENIAKLHSDNLIHGDLTTSNMIIDSKDPTKVTFIDFGLSYVSTSAEDKGVDLYVLERALKSTHSSAGQLFASIIGIYKQSYKGGYKEVMSKYEEVKARGRKRTMVG